MNELNKIGEALFNKIRGRFPSVTIGDEEGNVTNEPELARFFDFDYTVAGNVLGKVSISVDKDDGLTVIFSTDFIKDQDKTTRDAWYSFLKGLRVFSKKRMLNFSIRDITKSNLNKRDYKFLANNPKEGQMTEAKLYGTGKISYQNVDNARIVIKHNNHVNNEVSASRTRNIGSIYIESGQGERFRYPFNHLSGARAMARHVAEGGMPFDEFGAHIVSLSEEMNKLRKFKNYMGRSAVMAESLGEYVDVVKDRIGTVKKTIESLQKQKYYAEAFASFETPIMEDVPTDVSENWIDQLTIRQFNEELKDVFPYIYKLVSEATKATLLGPDELAEVASDCWDGYKKDGKQPGTGKNKGKKVNKCVPEDAQLEQGFDAIMGQFSEDAQDKKVCKDCGDTFDKPTTDCKHDSHDPAGNYWVDASDGTSNLGENWKSVAAGIALLAGVWGVNDQLAQAAYKNSAQLQQLISLHQQAEASGNDAYADKLERRIGNHKSRLDIGKGEVMDKDGNPKVVTDDDNNEERRIARIWKQISYYEKEAKRTTNDTKQNHLMQMASDLRDTLPTNEGSDMKEQQTPLSEFILSYFDREARAFPKGETAILTMVEKEYGDHFIEPAKQFIEQVSATFENFYMKTNPQQMQQEGSMVDNVKKKYNKFMWDKVWQLKKPKEIMAQIRNFPDEQLMLHMQHSELSDHSPGTEARLRKQLVTRELRRRFGAGFNKKMAASQAQ